MIVLINETLMVYKSLFLPAKPAVMSRNMVKKRVWIFGASRIGRGKKLGCFGVEWRKAVKKTKNKTTLSVSMRYDNGSIFAYLRPS